VLALAARNPQVLTYELVGRAIGVPSSDDVAGTDSARAEDSRPTDGAAGVHASISGATALRIAQLYRELFPAVFGFIRFRVGNVQVAEDLTALVFERALTKLSSVREADRVRAWLFTVARNAVAEERRRRKPTPDLEVAEALDHRWIESPAAQVMAIRMISSGWRSQRGRARPRGTACRACLQTCGVRNCRR